MATGRLGGRGTVGVGGEPKRGKTGGIHLFVFWGGMFVVFWFSCFFLGWVVVGVFCWFSCGVKVVCFF